MEQLKMILVKTNDHCISWTPKFADYFLGDTLLKAPNAHYIFGRKSIETVPFIKTLYETMPYKCLVLSRNFSFPKLIANIKLGNNENDPVYYVLGGKRVFSLFDKLVSEIICINVNINSIPHPDSIFYEFPRDCYEVSKVAQRNLDIYKQKITYDLSTFRNIHSVFTGWSSQENEYLSIGHKLLRSTKTSGDDQNFSIFSEKVSINLQIDNFPILTTREILPQDFMVEAITLYKNYVKSVGGPVVDNSRIFKNSKHFIQLFEAPFETTPDGQESFSHYSAEKSMKSTAVTQKKMQVSIQVYIPETNYVQQLPHDLSLYALFLVLLCYRSDSLAPFMLHLVIGRVYCSHLDKQIISQQVKRCPLPFPSICLVANEKDSEFIEVKLENYHHWPKILPTLEATDDFSFSEK
jgi:hypothetical protein